MIKAKYQGIEVEPQENSISVKDLEIFYKSFGLNTKVRTKDEVCWVRVILMKLGDERLPGLIEI